MSTLIWILGFFALLALVQYVAGPILVRFQIRSPAHPEIRKLEESELDPEAAGYFRDLRPELTALGFQSVGYLRLEEYARGQTWLLEAYVNPRTLDSGSANFLVQAIPGGRTMKSQAVAFTSNFDGGRMYGTSNSPDPTPFLRESSFLRERVVPGERHLPTLYRIHQAAAADFGAGRMKRIPGGGGEVNALRETLKMQMEARVDTGYFHLDQLKGHYRPTWPGAFAMTWALLWPLKPLRIWLARKQAAEILKLAPPEPASSAPAPETEQPVGARG